MKNPIHHDDSDALPQESLALILYFCSVMGFGGISAQ